MWFHLENLTQLYSDIKCSKIISESQTAKSQAFTKLPGVFFFPVKHLPIWWRGGVFRLSDWAPPDACRFVSPEPHNLIFFSHKVVAGSQPPFWRSFTEIWCSNRKVRGGCLWLIQMFFSLREKIWKFDKCNKNYPQKWTWPWQNYDLSSLQNSEESLTDRLPHLPNQTSKGLTYRSS